MDFCLKVCTEIETLFKLILESSKFDYVNDIEKKRKNQNIVIYREIIESTYQLRNYMLLVIPTKQIIYPLKNLIRLPLNGSNVIQNTNMINLN
jgi:hypothetical protein